MRIEERNLKILLIDQRHSPLEVAVADVILLKLLVRLQQHLERFVAVANAVVP